MKNYKRQETGTSNKKVEEVNSSLMVDGTMVKKKETQRTISFIIHHPQLDRESRLWINQVKVINESMNVDQRNRTG